MDGMKKSFSRLCLVGALVGGLSLSACASDDSTTLFGYVPPSTKNSASISVTEAGASTPFELRAAPDEMLIVYFGYTHCPDVCPTTLVAIKNAKKKVGAALADRVDLAMVTVDPERDTAEVLPRYLSSFTDKFHALVPASESELRAAEKPFGATSSVTKTDGEVKVVHGGTAYIVDSKGDVVVEWPFGLDAASMAHDIQVLLDKGKANT